jgi:hypothetical protein
MAASQARKRARAAKLFSPPAVKYDFGPIAARVTVESVADPLNPLMNIRRARFVPLYDGWWKRGGIDDEMREAADRYAITCEAEAGARERGAAGMPGALAPWQKGSPAETAMIAIVSLRAAHYAVGAEGVALLRLYVRDNLPMGEIAKRRRERESNTVALVRGALKALATHWGMYL